MQYVNPDNFAAFVDFPFVLKPVIFYKQLKIT